RSPNFWQNAELLLAGVPGLPLDEPHAIVLDSGSGLPADQGHEQDDGQDCQPRERSAEYPERPIKINLAGRRWTGDGGCLISHDDFVSGYLLLSALAAVRFGRDPYVVERLFYFGDYLGRQGNIAELCADLLAVSQTIENDFFQVFHHRRIG